jgi:hypothetical protein
MIMRRKVTTSTGGSQIRGQLKVLSSVQTWVKCLVLEAVMADQEQRV